MPVAREETGKGLSLFSLGEKQVLGNGHFFLLSVAPSEPDLFSAGVATFAVQASK